MGALISAFDKRVDARIDGSADGSADGSVIRSADKNVDGSVDGNVDRSVSALSEHNLYYNCLMWLKAVYNNFYSFKQALSKFEHNEQL